VYSIGKQRLFYISKIFGNKIVEAEIVNPSLVKSNKFLMTYLEDDIYYLDVVFKSHGSYIFKVYEDGDIKLRDILVVSRGQHLFYPNMDDVVI